LKLNSFAENYPAFLPEVISKLIDMHIIRFTLLMIPYITNT